MTQQETNIHSQIEKDIGSALYDKSDYDSKVKDSDLMSATLYVQKVIEDTG